MITVKPDGVLFLDIASNVGFAFGTDLTRCPAWGVWKLPPDWAIGQKAMALENELADAIHRFNPRVIGVELPLPASQQKSSAAAEVLIGLVIVAEGVCCRWDRQLQRRASGTLRAAVCGRSNRTDEEMREKMDVKTAIVLPWINAMGWGEIGSHDARDAAVGVAYELGYRHKRVAPARVRMANA